MNITRSSYQDYSTPVCDLQTEMYKLMLYQASDAFHMSTLRLRNQNA